VKKKLNLTPTIASERLTTNQFRDEINRVCYSTTLTSFRDSSNDSARQAKFIKINTGTQVEMVRGVERQKQLCIKRDHKNREIIDEELIINSKLSTFT